MARNADHHLFVACMRMGQGDCTVIKCPTGKMFIVDIGSSEGETTSEERNEIYTPKDFLDDVEFLKTDKKLDALILTHSDRDHYNKVGILEQLGVKVNEVYHTNTFATHSEGSDGLNRGEMSSEIIRKICKTSTGQPDFANIRRVIFTKDDKMFMTIDPADESKRIVTNIVEGNNVHEYSKDRGIKVHDCGECQIYMLCGSITKDDGEDTGEGSRSEKRVKTNNAIKYEKELIDAALINMASIITLVEFNIVKVVICGDAVQETEAFVMDTYLDILDVELLRAPHHGSISHGSSHEAFVARMNPRMAIFSSAKNCRTQPLPRCEVITRYVDKAPRLKKDDDGKDVEQSTWSCFYQADAPTDLSHTQRTAKIWRNPAATAKAYIRTTGVHDQNLWYWIPPAGEV